MGIGETDFTKVNFTTAGCFSPVNTVHIATSPMVNPIKIDFSMPKLPTRNVDKLEKEKPKLPKKIKNKEKLPPKNQLTKMMNFMGKNVEMTGHVEKNPDGTSTEFLINKDGGTCTINYDKDGKTTSITQELFSNGKYKYLSSKIDSKTNNTTSTSINRDADNTSYNEVSETRDKDNNLVETKEIIKNGNTLTTTKDIVVDAKEGVVRREDEVMNLKTSDQTRTSIETKINEKGEEVVLLEERTDTQKGVTTASRKTFDDNGNPKYESLDKIYPDGKRESERVMVNNDKTITETTSVANDKTGDVNQYTVQKDEKGNIVLESTFVRENGITTQEHQSYKNNQVVSHGVMETGIGVMNDTQSKLNEEGQWETKRTMVLQGKKYTDEAEFKKALDEHLKQQ